MVEEEWLSSEETAAQLGVTLNHLRQLQFRKQLVWGKKQGRSVFYLKANVQEVAERRATRKR